jgi:hypothetical protein
VDALVRVSAVPADLVEVPVARPGRPGTAGVLPLGFGRQSIPVGGRVPLDDFGLGTDVVRGREPAHWDRALQNRVASHQETHSTGNWSPRVALGRWPVICVYSAWVTGDAASW